ncbi:class I SAM-dependent methyltransferase [Rapidithrix thailandica]|uniref:Class I SAM-dependent methyltransferase n=1 Tax=Rapidithrix thailandica TaxID=413964 RepID=A0AAW9S747_9BACT
MSLIDTYKSLCTAFYDLDKPNAPQEAIAYYLNEIHTHKQPVLEPMCGSGRFLLPLMEKNVDIDGTDASSEMLESCELKGRAKALQPKLYLQKLQELELPRRYGLIFIPSGSFGLILNRQEALISLKNLFDQLLENGQLIIEIETPASASVGPSTMTKEIQGDNAKIRLTSTSEYDADNQFETTKCEYQKITKGEIVKTETEIIQVRLYSIQAFSQLLKTVGFTNIKALVPYSEKFAEETTPLVIVKCQKS